MPRPRPARFSEHPHRTMGSRGPGPVRWRGRLPAHPLTGHLERGNNGGGGLPVGAVGEATRLGPHRGKGISAEGTACAKAGRWEYTAWCLKPSLVWRPWSDKVGLERQQGRGPEAGLSPPDTVLKTAVTLGRTRGTVTVGEEGLEGEMGSPGTRLSEM